MNYLTKQETFTKVATHLLKQNAKSFIQENAKDGDACAYRGVNNTMCAAGCLITDKIYSPKMETKTVLHNTVSSRLKKSGIDMEKHSQLVMDFQYLHDMEPVTKWYNGLIIIAQQYGLEMPPKI